MYRTARLCLFIIWCVSCGLAGAEPVVVERESSLRVEPDVGAAVIVQLAPGTQAESLGRRGPWLQVKTDKATGWVFILDVQSLRGRTDPVTRSDAAGHGFNTPEGCAALGGVFRFLAENQSWQGRCYLAMTARECSHANGNESALDGASGYCSLPVTRADIARQCRLAGGTWGRIDRRAGTDYCHFPKLVQACLARGGSMRPEGLSSIPMCVIASKDGGKPCAGKSDCEFGCYYTKRPVPPSGTDVTGTCAASNANFGCLAYVADGKITTVLCGD